MERLLIVLFSVGLTTIATAAAHGCNDTGFYEAKSQLWIPCSHVCPPNKTTDAALQYCHTNCPEYYLCLMDKLPVYSSNISTGTTKQQQDQIDAICPRRLFYSGRFLRLARCLDACRRLHLFCQNNCPDYHACRVRNERRINRIITMSKYQVFDTTSGDHISTTQTSAAVLTEISPLSTDSRIFYALIGVTCFLFLMILLMIFAVVYMCCCKYEQREKVENVVEMGDVEAGADEDSATAEDEDGAETDEDTYDEGNEQQQRVAVGVQEQTPFIAQPVANDAGVGYSLTNQQFDKTVAENDTAEKLLGESRIQKPTD